MPSHPVKMRARTSDLKLEDLRLDEVKLDARKFERELQREREKEESILNSALQSRPSISPETFPIPAR